MKAINAVQSHKELILASMPKHIKSCILGKNKGNKPCLLEEQQEILKDYYVYMLIECSELSSYNTYLNRISAISCFGEFCRKPFNQVTREDIKHFIFYLKSQGRKESTINEYRIKIRIFFRFLYGTQDYPEVVDWIHIKKVRSEGKTEEDLLTKQEVKNLIRAGNHPRDRAIVAVLYESAARRAELLSTKIKHARFDKYGILLKLPKSKTIVRTIRLIDSVPYLQEWLNKHPYADNPEAALFCSIDKGFGNQLQVQGLKYIIDRCKRRTDISKKTNAHLFRHSRLNELAKIGFNERDLKLFAGWSKDSKMPRVYLHYGEKELDDKFLEKAGLLDKEDSDQEQQEREALKPLDCPRCNLVNSATSRYCNSCGMALDIKEYMDDQRKIKQQTDERIKAFTEIMTDPKKRAKYEEFKEMFFTKG